MSRDDGAELLFTKPTLVDALRLQTANAVKKVNSLDADYLLKASETDLIRSLESEFRVEPLQIRREAISAEEPRETEIIYSGRRAMMYGGDEVRLKGFALNVIIPFEGDAGLLQFQTPEFDLNPPRAKIVGQEIHLEYRNAQLDAEAVRKEYEYTLSRIELYIRRGQDAVRTHNEKIGTVIAQAVAQRKSALLQNMKAVEGLGIPIRRRNMPATYAVPTVCRKPRIELPKVPPGPYTPEPTLATDDYEYILKVIQDMTLVMERSPRAFARMEEEHLRDHFLVQLNGHFEGAATGETFNAEGKTDILIRHANRNVFIAECKFWKGDKAFMECIDQLLGYASWRDTKTAIILFNRNRDMTRVLEKIPSLVKDHANFKRELPQPLKTQFRYLLHQKNDTNRELILTVMVFDIPAGDGAGSDRPGPEGGAC